MIKKWIALIVISIITGSTYAASVAPYEYWTFDDDSAGVNLVDAINSGSLGSEFNYGGPGEWSTDGAGHAVISNHVGQTFRQMPKAGTLNADATVNQYDPLFTNGIFRLELDFVSWALDPAGTDELQIRLREQNNGNNVAAIRLQVQDGTNAVITAYTSTASGAQYRNLATFGLTNNTPVAAAVEFDIDNNTVTYFVDGAQANSFSDFNGTQVGQLQFFTQNGWSSNSVVVIDQMGYKGPSANLPVLAVDVNNSMILSGAFKGSPTVTLDTSAPALGTNDFAGQPFYTGLEEVDINGDPINAAASVTLQTSGFKLQWNSPLDSTGAYAAGDEATAAFVFMKEDFLAGLNEGQIVMSETNDTLTAAVEFDPGSPQRLSEANFRWLIKDAGQYYVSAPTTYTVSGSEVITAEALDVTWYEYYPETVSVSAISNAASPTLQNIQALGWQTDATVATNTGTRYYAKLAVTAFSAGASKIDFTPTSLWVDWSGGFALGANSNLLDHADSDDLDNLTEYAWGGDPTDGNSQGNVPVQSQVDMGGTNYMEYIYFERDDAATRGLSSILEVGTDLVFTNWVDGSSYEIGSGASGVTGFNAVTNRVPIDAEAKKFIRLQIEFTP